MKRNLYTFYARIPGFYYFTCSKHCNPNTNNQKFKLLVGKETELPNSLVSMATVLVLLPSQNQTRVRLSEVFFFYILSQSFSWFDCTIHNLPAVFFSCA